MLNGDKVSVSTLNNRVSTRLSLYWSNDPVGLVVQVDGKKKFIDSTKMQDI